jgi:hypothetical protein
MAMFLCRRAGVYGVSLLRWSPALDEAKGARIVLGSERICFMRVSKDAIIFNIPLRSIEDSPKTSIGEYPVVGAIVITFIWAKQIGYW